MFFGHHSPSDNPELFKKLVSTLANGVNQRISRDALALSSGLIVNSNGQLGSETLDLIDHTIKALQIDVVLVINQTMLYSSLKTAYSGSKVVFVAIRPIDGVITKVFFFVLDYLFILLTWSLFSIGSYIKKETSQTGN